MLHGTLFGGERPFPNLQGGISNLTTLLLPPLPPALRPGQSRRVDVRLDEPFAPLPCPPGDAVTRIIAVQEVCPPSDRYTPAPLGCLTLFLTRHGRAEVAVGGRTFLHQPGALITAASGCRIVEQVAPDQPWSLAYLQIAGPWAEGMDAWLRRLDPPVMVCPAVSARRRQVFTELVELALAQTDGWAWLFVSRLAELLGSLYSDSLSASPGDALLQQVARLLDAAPAERPSTAQMAASLQMTTWQFIYQFGKAAGEPLASWIRKRRIAAARRLLSQGQSVSSVAEQLGYANPYHFSRVFKAVTGATPSMARANAPAFGLHVREEGREAEKRPHPSPLLPKGEGAGEERIREERL